MDKPSKKSLCPFGSKRRYENCCRAAMVELAKNIRSDDLLRAQYTEKHGHIRRPVGVQLQGKLWIPIGPVIYQQKEEGPYNFINVIHDHALHFFGDERLDLEDAKDFDNRHPAIKWLHAHIDSQGPDGASRGDGNYAAWSRFAYDLYTIRENAQLQEGLRARLLDPKDFQSARYELKVAAICAAAGFDLAFEDETDNKRRHPEFVGTDRFTGMQIAVEAKSRHRKTVLGFGGGLDVAPGHAAGVRKNVLEAYKKQAEFPFYVFIDVNLPPADEQTKRLWEGELQQTMHDLDAEGYASPCPCNGIFFTNDPSHYVGTELIGTERDMLWVRCFTPTEPAIPHPSDDMTTRLLKAHAQRAVPPADLYENP